MGSGRWLGLIMFVQAAVMACRADLNEQHNDNGTIDSTLALAMSRPVRLVNQDLREVVSGFLAALSFTFDTVIAHSGPYYAVSAVRSPDGADHIIALKVTGDSVSLMSQPQEIPSWLSVNPELEWFSTGGVETDHLRYSADDAVEGLVETQLLRVEGDTLILEYQDAPDRCMASELRDVDGDARAELLVYVHHGDEPRPLDCLLCQDFVRSLFGIPIAWVEVRRWGENGWHVSERGYGEFYQHLADTYDQIFAWMSALEGPTREYCHGFNWTGRLNAIEDWRDRALALSRPGV